MVFWFLGMSGSGKTTIGSMLEKYLGERGVKTYRIDGDEIRDFFDRDLGYTITDRQQNMKRIMLGAYLLSKNDIVTIVCAVTPVESWRSDARKKIKDYHEFYLKRDLQILEENDVKGVYAKNIGKAPIAGIDIPFDEPIHSNLILDTNCETEDETFLKVRRYVDATLHLNKKSESLQYWKDYYQKHQMPFEPSSFAKYTLSVIKELAPVESLTIVELGCGNGRDSIFFADNGINITAIDQVQEEIDVLHEHFGLLYPNLQLKAYDFTNPPSECYNNRYHIIYSRFTWHSITEQEEERLLDWAAHALLPNGLIFIEARSIKDTLYEAGQKISETESFTDHYRRFVNSGELLSKLNSRGFNIKHIEERNGLAIHKDEDPVIVRLIASKQKI